MLLLIFAIFKMLRNQRRTRRVFACTELPRVARVVKGESAFHPEDSFEEIDDVHH